MTGALLALSFPPLPFNLLAFVGFVPVLFLLDHKPKNPFLLIYIAFFVYHGGTNWWISSWQADSDPYLMVAGIATWLVHPFFFMIPFAIYMYFKRKMGDNVALWFFPFIWIFYEWIHSLGDLAYPWLSIGYTQANSLIWAQFADIAGVWGLSFVIVVLNVLFYKIVLQIRESRAAGTKVKIDPRLIAAHLVIFILPFIYGGIVMDKHNYEDDLKNYPSLRIGMIQPSINPWSKWEDSVFDQIKHHQKIQDSLRAEHGWLDLGIWSETAIGYFSYTMNVSHEFSFLQKWVDTSKTNLLTGFADIIIYDTPAQTSPTAKDFKGDTSKKYDSYNSALMLTPGKEDDYQIYHKMRLTPFSERIPFIEYFPFLREWLEWGVGISSWALGKKQENLKIYKNKDTIKIAPVICIESIFPSFVADFIDKGADIVVIITNDAWYDYTFGPVQHYAIARMRAIETRRYIARTANSGVTGFIRPTGEDLLMLDQYISTGIAADVPALSGRTVFVRIGNLLCHIAFAVTLLGFLLSAFYYKRS